MSLLLFLVFGLVVGLIARALTPGDQKMGTLMTMGVGVAGSFIGGFLSSLVSNHQVTEFHTTGIIGSVIGAVLLLAVAGGLFKSRSFA